jgi:hydroxymethylpyrimidine pyrophosphatase-like HAD family hydrolase
VIFASDLDSTLIFPARTQPAGQRVWPVEYRDGRVLTCAGTGLTPALAGLAAVGVELVPVTARSRAMLDALAPFAATRYAITAAGGRIWHDGRRMPGWEHQRHRLLTDTASLAHAYAVAAAAFAGEAWIRGEEVVDGLWFFLTAAHDALPDDAAARAREALAALGWSSYAHGRKLYCLPTALRKESALSWLVTHLDADLLAAAGDSEMDLGLLELAPAGFCPAESSLAACPHRPAHTRITTTGCAGAGPEILRAAADLAPPETTEASA